MASNSRGPVLVLEGGGMKAAFANGVLSAFEAVGHCPWSGMVGSSAGGALAAWCSAGQARYAEGTWKYAADPRILSAKRYLLRRGPYLDHDALLRIVYEEEHPLNLDAVRRFPRPVYVTAVEVASGTTAYTDIRQNDILAWLRATGRLPFAAGDPVEIDGRQYLDGGISDPIPIKWALEHVAPKAVVIVNNLYAEPKKESRLADLLGRRFPALREDLVRHQALKWEGITFAREHPNVTVIGPEEALSTSRMDRDMDRVGASLEHGREVGCAYLAGLQATR